MKSAHKGVNDICREREMHPNEYVNVRVIFSACRDIFKVLRPRCAKISMNAPDIKPVVTY